MNNQLKGEQMANWLEKSTHLERDNENIIGYMWPSAPGVEKTLTEYFSVDRLLKVTPEVMPSTQSSNTYVLSAKHYELPEIIRENDNEEFLGEMEIEYGWALASTLTELAETSNEDVTLEDQIGAVEDLADTSTELMGDYGTVVWNTRGLEKKNYNPVAKEQEIGLMEYAERISDELVDNGFSEAEVYENNPLYDTPHIVGEL